MTAFGQFLEILIGGLLAGVLYSLVALGYVLIFKASGVFNFAQGAMVLLAGLALVRALDFMVARGVPFWAAVALGLLFAGLVMALCEWLVQRYVLGPLINQDGLTLFMSTIGATFILEGVAQMVFGSDVYPLRLFSDMLVDVIAGGGAADGPWRSVAGMRDLYLVYGAGFTALAALFLAAFAHASAAAKASGDVVARVYAAYGASVWVVLTLAGAASVATAAALPFRNAWTVAAPGLCYALIPFGILVVSLFGSKSPRT